MTGIKKHAKEGLNIMKIKPFGKGPRPLSPFRTTPAPFIGRQRIRMGIDRLQEKKRGIEAAMAFLAREEYCNTYLSQTEANQRANLIRNRYSGMLSNLSVMMENLEMTAPKK
jgi:hypothetical protein